MDKNQVSNMLFDKINEVFAEIQKQENIKHGDVDPMDEVMLNELTNKLADQIIKITDSQKEL